MQNWAINTFYLDVSLSLVSTTKSFLEKISWNDAKRRRVQLPTKFILSILSVYYSPAQQMKLVAFVLVWETCDVCRQTLL